MTITSDDLVEPVENFTIALVMATDAGSSLRLRNARTAVFIRDSDSMFVYSLRSLQLSEIYPFHDFFLGSLSQPLLAIL